MDHQGSAPLLCEREPIVISVVESGVSAATTGPGGFAARALHTGSLHAYVYWFLGGSVVLWFLATR